ncbi:hypothetical protein BJ508DRAFT_161905 [Ascobolus immersus RN42]|uniref:Uncharacterized protein n=1 Tax=Ascobolus immersus RN42 TaxID=1160509 RepID=A0A3N4HZL7_ASCIM|nr:hypothetical protein BJ508DRAFT_161905 [Ascobolus immersus RN42]
MAPPLVIVLDSDSEDEPVRGPKVRRIPSSIDAPSTAYTDSDHDNELGIRELARLRRGRQPSETVAQTSSEVIQEGPVLVTIDSDDDNIPETIDLTDFSDKTPEYRKQITQLHDTLKRSRASRVTNATKRTREAARETRSGTTTTLMKKSKKTLCKSVLRKEQGYP